MEALRGSSVANSFCAAKPFTSCSNPSSCRWRCAFGNGGDVSRFFLKLPSFRPQAVPGSRRLRIPSRRLGRSAKRRNSLREKLLGRPDQVRRVLESTAPQLPPGNAEPGLNLHIQREAFGGSTSDLDTRAIHGGSPLTVARDVEKDVQTEPGLGRGELGGKSVLWNKLENWVERYKEDWELWGIGAAPIFTIYKDSHGNVTRVSLNEDEIIKRSRLETWSLQPKEINEEPMDVHANVSRAKLIAKQIESGECKLPKNSTIAKIIVEGSKSSFSIDRFHSLNFGGKTLFKHSPKIVFGVFIGCFVFLSLKKWLFTNDTTELTRDEKEMLRRKLKLRMERRTAEKGSVDVLRNVPDMPMGTVERPPLDKDELMKSIKAKVSTEGYMKSNLGSQLDVTDEKFKDHVREIRDMVKQVHELERKDQQHVDKRVSECDACFLPTATNELLAMSSDVNLETHAIVSGSDCGNVPDDSVLEESTGHMNFAGVMEDTTVVSPTNTPDGERRKTISTDKVIEPDILSKSVTGTLGCVKEMPIGVSSGHANSEDSSRFLDMGVIRNEKMERGLNKGEDIDLSISQNAEGIQFDPTCSDNSSVHKNSNRVKPKIIVSVKEAREYLSHRFASTADKLQSKPETQDNQPISPLANGSPNSTNEGMNMAKLLNTDILKRAKDRTLVRESGSHLVLDCVPKVTDKRSVNPPPCTAAVTGISSVDVGTSEPGSQNGTSLECAEEKIPQKEATTSAKRTFKKEEDAVLEELHESNSSDLTNEEHQCQQIQIKSSEVCDDINDVTVRERSQKNSRATGKDRILAVSSSESTSIPTSMIRLSADREIGDNDDAGCEILRKADTCVNLRPSSTCNEAEVQGNCLETEHDIPSLSDNFAEFSPESTDDNCNNEVKHVHGDKSWIERNFQQFDPIIKKIGMGFQENYMTAKEKVQEQKMVSAEMGEMALEDEELEWMNDDNLRDIVFKVRDNELAGREPFHLMDADEQCAFFQGLERKAEKQNKKMLVLHELIHSKIENIDYGRDGISLDDSLEKIVPRWKGPPISEDPEFLNNFARDQQVTFKSKVEASHAATDNTEESLQKSDQTSYSDALSSSFPTHNLRNPSRDSVNSKSVIECSDGSSRAGKKLGKEHWEHTKKWSREFLELYNAETDPEIKSIMRNMGKDLDKWITEKEIQDVADLMTRIPKRKRRYIEKKLDKLKREIEMFGHQAVASKYREYAEEKEEDYLWWLDLSFILCIELYRTEDNAPKVGFYSLEMAADLELSPKQYHVIAFEDPGDSKNFCYIIQAHMEMLGNGSAFVVARPPKDAFREAKANGFNVTVIRKGELNLNVDLTLEEVEEEIIEIGSKMYHDKIMHERGVDMGALMKGVFNADKSTKRKSKRMLKKPTVR